MKTMKKSHKIVCIALAVLLALVLSIGAFAAAQSAGSIRVNSRYTDNSVQSVTVSNFDFTYNNVEYSGTFTVYFPQGYTYNTPTAEQCMSMLSSGNPYASYGGINGNGYNNGYSNNGVVGTYETYSGSTSIPTTGSVTTFAQGYGHYTIASYNNREVYVFVGEGRGNYEYDSYSGIYSNQRTYTFVGSGNVTGSGQINTYTYRYVGSGQGNFEFYDYQGFGYVGNGRGSYTRTAYDSAGNVVSYNNGTTNNGTYYNGGTTQVNTYKTQAQIECEARIGDFRTFVENYGVSVSFTPSTTTVASDANAWYAMPNVWLYGNQLQDMSWSVNTARSGNAWNTIFYQFINGQKVFEGNLAQAEAQIQTLAQNAGNYYGSQPLNVVSAYSASDAFTAMTQRLSQRGVTATVNSQNGSTATLSLSRLGSMNKTVTMIVESKGSGLYRCNFYSNNTMVSVKDVFIF